MIRNLQVWVIFGTLFLLAFVAMFFISRSNMVIERSRSAAETRALRNRKEAERDRQVARAIREMDREIARLLALESSRPVEDFRRTEPESDSAQDGAPSIWESVGGQANSFALMYFSQDGRQPATTRWSLENRQLAEQLPSWNQVAPSDWATLWQTTRNDTWMPDPAVFYRINAQVQHVLRYEGGMENLLPPGTLLDPDLRDVPLDPLVTSRMGHSMYPVWIDRQLCLIRWVPFEDGGQIQGCVLHWERIRDRLTRLVEDDFENRPTLVPVLTEFPRRDPSRFSSWLPLQMELTPVVTLDRPYPSDGGWVLLGLGWLFLLITCAAVGLLLHTVLRMSNRREAFVSSVTHELRTPLTTFRLYADLLAKAPDPEKTRQYAKTLQNEAERLSHLVENVLCYSRMEKRGITSHHRMTSVGELVDAMVPRLEEHCFRAGMILDYSDAQPEVRRTEILTDPSAVDRILVNLVDNACKYGRTEESQVVELAVRKDGRWLIFEVADQGPGLAKAQRRRLFKAYNHGQIGADSPNTTIGLGLNICFQLAKALGGSLEFADNHPGCRFILKVPMDLHRR